MWKLLFRSPLGSVHTKPEEFENAALFLMLDLPSTLIRHENELFKLTRTNLENAGFSFSCERNTFCRKTELFENDAVVSFPWLKFLRRIVDGKHLMRFQSVTSVFKFLRGSVNWALVTVMERNYLMTILTVLCLFCQRLTCSLSLLLSFFCVNIAWYRPKTEVRPCSHNSKLFRSCTYLCFKTSLGAQPFIWKWVFLAHSLSSKSMNVVHQGSFGKVR